MMPVVGLIKFGSRVLRNEGSRTPPGPEGSNGSDFLRVLQGARLPFFLTSVCLVKAESSRLSTLNETYTPQGGTEKSALVV